MYKVTIKYNNRYIMLYIMFFKIDIINLRMCKKNSDNVNNINKIC